MQLTPPPASDFSNKIGPWQLLCRTSQVARLLSSKNNSRRAHIGIYVGTQEILSSKSNTSSSINRSAHPTARRRVKSMPASSFKSVYKQLLKRGVIGSNHRSPGTTLKLLFNTQSRVILRATEEHRIQPRQHHHHQGSSLINKRSKCLDAPRPISRTKTTAWKSAHHTCLF